MPHGNVDSASERSPSTAFAISAQTGNMTSGLWYPIGVALASCAIGLVFVKETRGVDIDAAER